jgi:TetR/AcrR family transcriptional repressor of nem operon
MDSVGPVLLHTVWYVSSGFGAVKTVDSAEMKSLHTNWYAMGSRGAMPRAQVKRRTRDPGGTRERLLRAAFEEIYRTGFQAASLQTILAKAGVTKGALYHHFPDKAALGEAVVAEVVKGFLLQRWGIGPLAQTKRDPVTALQQILRHRAAELTAREVELGCPLNNLAQEMSPLDERFRRQVMGTFETWTDALAKALKRGQEEGSVRRELDSRKVAAFIVAAIEGSFGLAKGAQSGALLRANLEVLGGFLDTLRPETRPKGRKKSS